MKKDFQLTKAGVESLESELAELEAQRRPIAEKIKTAREFGDLSENAEYQAAIDERQKTETRIAEIENILKNVEIIEQPKSATVVVLGNNVTIKSSSNGEQTFHMVGSVEANPAENKISIESPIGSALLGKKVGDEVQVGSNTFKILKIN